MRFILVVPVVLLALMGARTQTASAAVPPPGGDGSGMICIQCDGGGAAVGCSTVADIAEDGWNDTIWAVYHWCWNWGNVTYGSGYCDYTTTWYTAFNGWSQNNELWYGWDCVGHYTWQPWSWPSSRAHRCVAVDGWGNAWTCRGWNE